MKKIILIAYDLNPNIGSECATAHQWLKIVSKHYFVEVFTDKKHEQDILKETYSNINFNFINIDSLKSRFLRKMKLYNLSNNIFIKKLMPELKTKIKNNKYHLIHCITPQGIHSYNDVYKLHIPVIIGPLGGGLKTPPGFEKLFKKGKLKSKLRDSYYDLIIKHKKWQQYFSNASKIIIGTPYIKKLLPKNCDKNTTVIFDILVDPNKFKKNKIKKSKQVKIFFSGRMDPQKGCELLLIAFMNISKKYNNVSLDFAGDGSSLQKLKKIVKHEKNNKINFLGKIPRDKVLELLNQSDIFCLPTLREPGGTSILEAMSCELPIITTNYGGPAYSVTEECGIKIEPTNYDTYIKDLEKALIYLIENKNERIRMGKNARERVIKEFSPAAVEKKIIHIYNEVSK